jgi:hypothetical protein
MTSDPRGLEAGATNRVPDALLDAFFDGDLDDAGKRCLFDGMRNDPAAAERFARTMFAMEQLRRRPGADAPDFSRAVLAEVDRRRRWLTPSARRAVQVGRLGAVAAILVVLAGGFIYKRNNPQSALLADRPAPLTSVVETSRIEARQGIRGMASAFAPIQGAVAELSLARTTGTSGSLGVACQSEMQVVRFVTPTELPAAMPWCTRPRTSGVEAAPAVWTLGRTPATGGVTYWPRPATASAVATPARVIVIPGG